MLVHVHQNLKPQQSENGGLALFLTEANTGTQVRVYGPQGDKATRLLALTKLAKELKEAGGNGYVHITGNIDMVTKKFVNAKTGRVGTPHLPAFAISVMGPATQAEAIEVEAKRDALRQKHLESVAGERSTVLFDTSNYRAGAASRAQEIVETPAQAEAEVELPQS